MKSLVLIISLLSSVAWAEATKYKVTVTNLTTNQRLSAPLLVIHKPTFSLFTPGQPASEGIAYVAEDGDRAKLKMEVEAQQGVESLFEAKNGIAPGASVTYTLTAKSNYSVLSFATMLVTTNDGFTGVSGLPLPLDQYTGYAPAFDAGSEANTESCMHIPGPPCSAHGVRVPAAAEGRIEVHPGILGNGELKPMQFNWSNPVIKVQIQKL